MVPKSKYEAIAKPDNAVDNGTEMAPSDEGKALSGKKGDTESDGRKPRGSVAGANSASQTDSQAGGRNTGAAKETMGTKIPTVPPFKLATFMSDVMSSLSSKQSCAISNQADYIKLCLLMAKYGINDLFS